MLNQDCNQPESSRRKYIPIAPIKGQIPKKRLMFLYLPVLCIIQPANIDPMDIDRLLGSRCKPEGNVRENLRRVSKDSPAVDALVKMTVWNHMG